VVEAVLALKVLNMLQAGMVYFASRGVNKDRVQALIDSAEGGDLTTEQVQAELDAGREELAETQRLIDEMPGDSE